MRGFTVLARILTSAIMEFPEHVFHTRGKKGEDFLSSQKDSMTFAVAMRSVPHT